MPSRLRSPALAAERGEEKQIADHRQEERVGHVAQDDRGPRVLVAHGEARVVSEAFADEGAGQEDEQEVELVNRTYTDSDVVVDSTLLRVLFVHLVVDALSESRLP